MIGRYATPGTLSDVGPRKIAMVAAAGLLLAAAGAVHLTAILPGRTVVILSFASLFLTGFPVVVRAARGVARFQSNVDELVSLAILACMVLGEWLSAAAVAFIMVLGSMVEEYLNARSRRHLEALFAASPEHALLLDDRGETHQVPIAELRRGQHILVRPGDVIAADGVVLEGESSVDESLLTGESAEVDKAGGDVVCGGTINRHGALVVKVERTGADSAHGRVLDLIREAERHRAPILRVAESYARWFTPAILALAAAVWSASGDPHRAVAMLIVGCPCAFVLATPTAVVAALSRAAREGLLVKGGRYLEGCAKVDLVAFDKTGTLTTGECRIVDVVPFGGNSARELLAVAAGLETGAEHPLARAIRARAREEGVEVEPTISIRREPGLGIVERGGDENAEVWRIGNERFMRRHGVDVSAIEGIVRKLPHRGQSIVYMARGTEAKGCLCIEDTVRVEAAAVVAGIRAEGIDDIHLMTGDAEAVAGKVAAEIGVGHEHVAAGLLPEEKYERIRSLEEAGRRVCYVGDGTNDGPALSLATVGVSVGSRENTVALETASVVLMRNSLAGLPFLLRLGRATRRVITQNLILFGLLFNGAMLMLSGAGFLTPIAGALAHNAGSVAGVLNSARLLLFERLPLARTTR